MEVGQSARCGTLYLREHNTASCEMARMKHIAKSSFAQLQSWHGLVLVSILTLALLGQMPDSQAGWLTTPGRLPDLPTPMVCRKGQGVPLSVQARLRSLGRYMVRSWPQAFVRSLLLAVLWSVSGRQGPVLLVGWPWLLWLWQAVAAGWPEVGQWRAWRPGPWGSFCFSATGWPTAGKRAHPAAICIESNVKRRQTCRRNSWTL
jgi:hypothetical protein